MKKISFTIFGNHKSQTGNAVPKLRMTGNQSWKPEAQSYAEWKAHVITALLDAEAKPEFVPSILRQNVARYKKPIIMNDNQYALMAIGIYWSNKAHGDPENIFGSIADALFKNDKNLDVVVVSGMTDVKLNGKPRGYVKVNIYFFDSQGEKEDYITKRINL